MSLDRDHFEAYYGDKLWQLLPPIYRSLDSDSEAAGPLRELVARVGAQAAIVRRSLERMAEDASIESGDDWTISYIADLLSTNLVASLDARGQRIDVAKTIYYRRRKGTVALLEELASDLTGWEALVSESFRRLGRSRHGLDPAVGRPTDASDPLGERELQLAQGLVGPLTGGAIGGFADLRDAYGATLNHSAFDEAFHAADVRRGVGQIGWYNIPRLAVFLWRLYSFAVEQSTPVPVLNCPGHYTFDPSGREIPLFAANAREGAHGVARPTRSAEWELPTPIGRLLLDDQLRGLSHPLVATDMDKLYPASIAVYHLQGAFYDLVDDVDHLRLFPERGRFAVDATLLADTLRAGYCVGFSSTIGAGTYDRRVPRRSPPPQPGPPSLVSGGGGALAGALAAIGGSGTVTIGDSLTYTSVTPVAGIGHITIRGSNRERPVVRMPSAAPNPAAWVLTGLAGSELVLEGLWIVGGDVILRGRFDRVRLVCCTFDPGQAAVAPGTFATAADGRALEPSRLFVEGAVRQVVIERSVVGPIRVRGSGTIESLEAHDSIIQSLWSELALRQPSGDTDLDRCTLMGAGQVHRLTASESILDDTVEVEDTQHGCIRFSAWATGSVLPRKYESVEVSPRAPLFSSRIFGRPSYGQLLAGVDRSIVSGAVGATVSEGATDGSEMGAFARERAPIKSRSLDIKFEEFMPLGLTPVLIPVT
jgi:hypothetical protein